MQWFKFFILIFIISLSAKAQNHFDLKIYDHKKLENQTLKVFSENGIIYLIAMKPDFIKVGFSTLPEINPISIADNGVYVRVTQNLDDIFMQTDSLLIIINKLDFSIKYKSIKEKLFLVNNLISLNDSCNILGFRSPVSQEFKNSKGKKLKQKTYNFENQKLISSSKNYSILFRTKGRGLLKVDEDRNKLTLSTRNKLLGYYFIVGVHNLEKVLKWID